MRKDIFKARGKRCEKCPSQYNPEVHHLTYVRFGGRELPRDLQILCPSCHAEADRERKRIVWLEISAMYAEEREQRAYETYMEKVHGPGWHVIDSPGYRQEFDEWLEKKQLEESDY